MIKLSLTGEWQQAKKVLASTPAELAAAIPKAIGLEAQYLVSKIVRRMGSVSPGISSLTRKTRRVRGFGGTKALIVSGDLRNSIGVIQQGYEAFIGVARSASRFNLAVVHELGKTVVIAMTAKMRGFLFGKLFARRQTTRTIKSSNYGKGGSGAKGIIIVRIPARPFIKPVFDDEGPGSPERFGKWLGRFLPKLGKP